MCGLHITHGIGKPFLVHIFKYSFCCRRDLQSFQLVYLDYAILYGHLGPDYDAQFSSISDPTGTSAPLPPGTMHKGVEDFEYYITYINIRFGVFSYNGSKHTFARLSVQ